MKQKIKNNKGITLLVLVITIIVLLILAGITIGAITGEDGIIQNAITAKERAEIANEREIVEEATVRAMGNNKRGNIVRNELQDELDKITGEGETIVTTDTEEGGYFVKFVDSGRIYKVSIDGDVEYLGKENELITQAEIVASPESNTTPALIQQVDLTVKTPIEIEGAEYSLVYAWNQDKEHAPEDTKFLEANLIGEGRIRNTTVYSSDTVGGDYYLWVRIVVGEIEREACFGPYTIRDHTTLIATSGETASTSGFLGSKEQEGKESVKEIERGLIESVNIETSLAGHSKNDANTWDVSQKQDGMYLAWYEDSDNDGYYEITIGGDGGVVANSNSSYLFANIGYGVENQEVTITGLENLETGLTTSMRRMFGNCTVQQLNLNTFDTNKVTDMNTMFQGCSKLTNLDLNKINTSKVTNMESIFNSCLNLKTLELSTWDTSKVTNMLNMFRNCQSLTNLNLDKLNTSNVIDMRNMFFGCQSLIDLNLSAFDTSNVTRMGSMFSNCSSLTSLNISSFNTINVTDMSWMFTYCSSLTDLNISNFNTNNVTDMSAMFQKCSSLANLNISSFNAINVTSMAKMFNYCSNLKTLDLSNFNAQNVTNMGFMFAECHSLESVNLSGLNTINVTNMSWMFQACMNLKEINFGETFYTDEVTSMNYMFQRCNSLTYLDLSSFNMQNVTNWGEMFTGVTSTIEIKANADTETWLKERFTNLTNIHQ